MKKKLLILATAVLLGMYSAPAIFAKTADQPNSHKPVHATEVEIIKKASISDRGNSPSASGKPVEEPTNYATGDLGTGATGIKYAIVIGIADYEGTVNDLNYTDDDALAMEDVLISKYNFQEENITLLLDDVATRENILNTIEDINNNATTGSEVVFFYSGHGGTGRADDGDEERKDEFIYVYDGPLWDGELKTAFENFATERIVFIFDSCVAGGMDDLAAPNRVINMATQEKRFTSAWEFDSLGHGEFTYYFVVKGMGEDQADTTGIDGLVTVEEAFDYAKQETVYGHPTINDGFENDLLL